MTIFRYRHVSEWPRVYEGLRHGIEAIVHRSDPEAAPSAEGSTVVLQAGDEIETPAPIDHPHLQPVNAAAKKAAAGSDPNPPEAADSGDPESTGESK